MQTVQITNNEGKTVNVSSALYDELNRSKAAGCWSVIILDADNKHQVILLQYLN